MSKEADTKFLKLQTCVVKVNICCDGCQKKVKKVLHKIDGVYTTTIDVENRKVTVTGNVDPAILIRKLRKAGKHAELWSVKGGNPQNVANQLQKLQLQHVKQQQKEHGKTQNGSGGGSKGGGGGGDKHQKGQQPQQQQLLQQFPQQAKGFKDLKFPNLKNLKFPFKKNTKAVKFNLHPEDERDDESDSDDEDDEFDEDLDDVDGIHAAVRCDPKMTKLMNFQSNVNGLAKDKKGPAAGGSKGGGRQLHNKAVGGNNGGGGKRGGGSGGGHANHSNPSHGGNRNDGVGGGLPMSNMQTPMGLVGSFPGYFQGGTMPPPEMMAGANPYQQQLRQRMMMNGPDRPALGYGYGRPAYMAPPHPHGEPYSMFSDEDPNGCSIV
ncbi:heavy metal-associated domain containing protein [Musa troglodytarum]|uniref:Heavy metal-associated domain containing protein n=1 Tax=Musa troglodytarum TaxID=320322 RepID=A0A9E7JHL2_9LILI|nr:heavy metal-associated domain containing protein [Musa troglodytarum]